MPYRAHNRSRLPAVILATAILPTWAGIVEAAGPRFIMIYGGTLSKPVILDNWQENIEIMHAVAEGDEVPAKELSSRPYFELAFFSGSYWVRYAEDGKPTNALHPDSADQRGRFYPAVAGAPPILAYDVGLAHRVGPRGLAILSRHGVPVLVESKSKAWLGWLVAAVSISIIILTAWLIKKRLSRLL